MRRRGFLGWMFGAPAAAVAGKAVAKAIEKLPELLQHEEEPDEWEEGDEFYSASFNDELDCVSAYVPSMDYVSMEDMLKAARKRIPSFVVKKG
jgi:hypothetical protein